MFSNEIEDTDNPLSPEIDYTDSIDPIEISENTDFSQAKTAKLNIIFEDVRNVQNDSNNSSLRKRRAESKKLQNDIDCDQKQSKKRKQGYADDDHHFEDSGCSMSKQLTIEQSHLIQLWSDQSTQIAELHGKLDLLLGQGQKPLNGTDDTEFHIPEFLRCLPVKDDPSFCHLNELLTDDQNKKAIIKFLGGIGGKNVHSLASNMLRRILVDEVAQLYSLSGKQMKNAINKKPFIATSTCKIIFHICKKEYNQTTEEKLKEAIGDWLNQAKVRISRRAEREKKLLEADASILMP